MVDSLRLTEHPVSMPRREFTPMAVLVLVLIGMISGYFIGREHARHQQEASAKESHGPFLKLLNHEK